MSDLDRLVALAGLATDAVAQSATNETTIEEGDCDCDCGESPCKTCGEDHHSVEEAEVQAEEEAVVDEAVGEAAEMFYEMQDMYAGGESPSKPHETIIDELVRFLSGDQLEDFVMTFRRHHMDLGDEMFKDDVDLEEDDIDENAFNQAAAAAARAGKDTFEFGGKTHKTTMKKDVAHKLDDDVQMEEVSEESEEETLEEAPTMDTTQLITLLKNAGVSEEAIQEKLNEWANTPSPELVGELEPTAHGDAYDFAQGVNLSLKRYLDAEDMKVGLKEHTVEELKAAYKASKDEG